MVNTIHNFRRGDVVIIARQVEHDQETGESIEWNSEMHRLYDNQIPGLIVRVEHVNYDTEKPLLATVLFLYNPVRESDHWNFLLECIDLSSDPQDIVDVTPLYDILESNYD